jgi:hypothetical protein
MAKSVAGGSCFGEEQADSGINMKGIHTMKKMITVALLGGAITISSLLGAGTASATTPEEICDAIASGGYQDFIMGKLMAGEDPEQLAQIDVKAQSEVCPK